MLSTSYLKKNAFFHISFIHRRDYVSIVLFMIIWLVRVIIHRVTRTSVTDIIIEEENEHGDCNEKKYIRKVLKQQKLV